MSTEIKNISISEIVDFVNNLEYGSYPVKYDNEETRYYMLEAINVSNRVNENKYLEERPLVVDYMIEEKGNNQFAEESVSGAYRIFMGGHNPLAEITEDYINLREKAILAKKEETNVMFETHPNLIKYAKFLAKNNNIRFAIMPHGFQFDGRQKSRSVFKQIQDAYMLGKDKIFFGPENSVHTIRCYASTLAGQTATKISCSVSKEGTTVYFGERLPETVLIEQLTATFHEYCKKIDPDKVALIFQHVAGTIVVSGFKDDEHYEYRHPLDVAEEKEIKHYFGDNDFQDDTDF